MAGGPKCITIKLVLMYTLKENYRQVKTQEVQERQSSQLVGTQELLRTTILLKQYGMGKNLLVLFWYHY